MHALYGNRNIGYNVASWNCRRGLLTSDGSPTSKMIDVQMYLQKHQLHIFGLIEADLHGPLSRVYRRNPLTTADIHDKLKVDGYQIILPQTWYIHDQARIVMYVREDVNFQEIKRNRNIISSDLPSISVQIGLGREKKTCVNIFYREFTGGVSGLSDLESQNDRLSRQIELWKILYDSGRDVLILGDCNLCAEKWNDEDFVGTELANKVQNFLLEQASLQLVTSSTRIELLNGRVQKSMIDHCYTDSIEKVSGPFIETVGDSDHMGVRIVKHAKTPVTRPRTVQKRCYKNFCVEAFLLDIYHSGINEHVTLHRTIEEASIVFKNEFEAILNFHAPLKTIQIRKNYCPFLTEDTKLSIRERNTLYAEACRTGDATLLQEFKIKSKEVKKLVNKDKNSFQQTQLGDNSSSKRAWAAARSILGLQKSSSPTTVLDERGQPVSDPSLVADIFNNYFIEEVRIHRAKTENSAKIDPISRLKNWLTRSGKAPPQLKLQPISIQKLRSLVKRMKGGRSFGIDKIDSFSIKLAAPLIEDALQHLINLSITTSTFSTQWKPQMIFPLHKKSDKERVENYRPVSHLVEIGKLVEYEVYDQVIQHFNENKLFHANHHGGLPNHSTSTALVQLHDMFLKAAESRKLSAALLLDQSAAYDLLDHSILLKKLAAYNCDENVICWFKSYLSGRSQAVQVESKQSSLRNLGEYAAPQGSVLGGLLFTIYENDFPACRHEGDSVMFVDDDTDFVSDFEPDNLIRKMQKEADLSCDWLKDNRMCVAGQKSKFMIIGTREMRRRKCDGGLSIWVDGKQIFETQSEKLLGVVINNSMTWKEHLYGESWHQNPSDNSQGLISQLSQRLGILRKIAQIASKKKLKIIAQGLFYSKMAYCLPLFINTWGLDVYRDVNCRNSCLTKRDISKLQVLQNQVLRLFFDKARVANMSTVELLKLSNELSVHQQGAFSTLCLAKKIILTNKPEYLASHFRTTVDRGTRSGIKLYQNTPHLGLAREGFLYRAMKLYNLIPESMKQESSFVHFKIEVRKWTLENISVKP